MSAFVSGERFRGSVGTTVGESQPWWEPKPKPGPDAPNVVVVVLDDTGFAQLGCYGSDIETPNIDRLAESGLRYTNFHTTALCSPTRACLLSGRNHHSVGMRFLSNVDTGFSNCRGVISPTAATMPELLQQAGYSTFAVGKWHLANMEDCAPAGPMSNWPLGRGFDRFYGFLGGATDQFAPELVIDNRPVNPPSEPGYHISEAMIDEVTTMISSQRATSTRPFFAYVAFGATHSPHQAPVSYREKYRGRYDEGWDVVRQRWFERQKELGVIPADTELSPRNPGIKPWDELSDDQRRLFARMQETFAAFLDHTDDQIGRLVDYLDKMDELDNTLFILLSDNGASQEGGSQGVLNELAFFNRVPQRAEEMIERIDEIGGPTLYNNYPKGWSQVGNTPLRFYKQNTYEGGIRDPLILHWPAGITAGGETREQYHHAIDLMPTVLDCLGIEPPDVYKGVPQQPVEGMSISYTFGDAEHPSRRTTQYYEMLGHRGIYHDGWKAVTMHEQGTEFTDDGWHLYHVAEDFAEIYDLAAEHPEKLAALKELWWQEAGRYNVLPLDDRSVKLFAMRRPDSELNRPEMQFHPGMGHIERFVMPDVRNRSWRITASVERVDTDDGVLVAFGCRTGGHTLFIRDGHLVFVYNYLGQHYTEVVSPAPLGSGGIDLIARFDKTDEHRGVVTLNVGGEDVASSPEFDAHPWRTTMYGMDIGCDRGTTVSPSYDGPFAFSGMLERLVYSMADDRHDLQRAAVIEGENALIDQ